MLLASSQPGGKLTMSVHWDSGLLPDPLSMRVCWLFPPSQSCFSAHFGYSQGFNMYFCSELDPERDCFHAFLYSASSC